MKKIKGVHRILFPENPQSKGRMVVSLNPCRYKLHHISDKLHPEKKWTKRRNKTSSDPPLKVTARLAEHLEDLRSKEGSLTLRTPAFLHAAFGRRQVKETWMQTRQQQPGEVTLRDITASLSHTDSTYRLDTIFRFYFC